MLQVRESWCSCSMAREGDEELTGGRDEGEVASILLDRSRSGVDVDITSRVLHHPTSISDSHHLSPSLTLMLSTTLLLSATSEKDPRSRSENEDR